jgi:hypothetical protein
MKKRLIVVPFMIGNVLSILDRYLIFAFAEIEKKDFGTRLSQGVNAKGQQKANKQVFHRQTNQPK